MFLLVFFVFYYSAASDITNKVQHIENYLNLLSNKDLWGQNIKISIFEGTINIAKKSTLISHCINFKTYAFAHDSTFIFTILHFTMSTLPTSAFLATCRKRCCWNAYYVAVVNLLRVYDVNSWKSFMISIKIFHPNGPRKGGKFCYDCKLINRCLPSSVPF